MKSLTQIIAERKEEPERQFVTCLKRKRQPRVGVEVCAKCKIKRCKEKLWKKVKQVVEE